MQLIVFIGQNALHFVRWLYVRLSVGQLEVLLLNVVAAIPLFLKILFSDVVSYPYSLLLFR